jgi:hypothetical protein
MRELRYSSTHFLTSAPDGDKRSASRPSRFIPGERRPGTDRIEHWVGPRAGVRASRKKKGLPLSRIEPQVPGCPVRSLVTLC